MSDHRSAAALAHSVRSGEQTALQILTDRQPLAERAAQLNVFTATDWDAAVRTASDIDRRRAAGAGLGPLAGVPISVKDVIAVAGLPLTAGSRAFAGRTAGTTAPAVARLQAADAVVVGKTNCPEFAFGSTCDNELFGRTGNPRFPGRSPGGSSGGEAAAVAAGLSTLGVGTDFGGSLRWPAQCTGIVALRPTAGRLDGTGQVPGLAGAMGHETEAFPSPVTMQGRLQVIGPMANRIEDLQLALRVMDGAGVRHEEIAASVPRIGWSTGRHIGPVRAEVARFIAEAAAGLAQLGWPCQETPDVLAGCLTAYNALRDIDPMHDHLRAVRGREDRISARCLATFRSGANTDPDSLADAWRTASIARRTALQIFSTVDVLLLPVAAGPACDESGGIDVDGTRIDGWELMAHCRAVTLLGTPSVSVPVGRSVEGWPLSIQVIAAPWADELALRVAAELEQPALG